MWPAGTNLRHAPVVATFLSFVRPLKNKKQKRRVLFYRGGSSRLKCSIHSIHQRVQKLLPKRAYHSKFNKTILMPDDKNILVTTSTVCNSVLEAENLLLERQDGHIQDTKNISGPINLGEKPE